MLMNSATGAARSEKIISKSTDQSMGAEQRKNGSLDPGVSVRYGPVGDGDVDMEDAVTGTNGHAGGKRRARVSAGKQSYAEAESSEDDKPLVCTRLPSIWKCFTI
jgi:DNA topoisomerase I